MAYESSKDILEALLSGKLKRSSAMSTKRRLKAKGDHCKETIYEDAIVMFDDKDRGITVCSYYNKPVDDLTAYELISLYDKDHRLFTKSHCKRFSIVMLEDDSNIKVSEYNGIVIHPRDIT
ncbi:hypothetical protein VPH166E361_0114 [Vibrio phage 166E36-1]